jgi:hypothetical protein
MLGIYRVATQLVASGVLLISTERERERGRERERERDNPMWVCIPYMNFLNIIQKFRNDTFLRGGIVSPNPNRKLQDICVSWPLSFDICVSVAQPGTYAPASISPCVTAASDPLHDKALVLEECTGPYLMNAFSYEQSILCTIRNRTVCIAPCKLHKLRCKQLYNYRYGTCIVFTCFCIYLPCSKSRQMRAGVSVGALYLLMHFL